MKYKIQNIRYKIRDLKYKIQVPSVKILKCFWRRNVPFPALSGNDAFWKKKNAKEILKDKKIKTFDNILRKIGRNMFPRKKRF